MDLARYLVDAVVLEGRSLREVASDHGVSKSWVHKLVARFRSGGYEALAPLSKAPRSVPLRTCDDVEEAIVRIRKELIEGGFDAGAHTIHYHLGLAHATPPSVSTIWRVLKRRGFIVPQPHKRPRSSYIRFEAALPNECWQSDVTFYDLADGTKVEILNVVYDFSRICIASRVLTVTRSPDVVGTLYEAGSIWGLPASLLTDNGRIYTSRFLVGGFSALESVLYQLGITYKRSRPYHPQTCGKVERFHQTEKRFLDKQDKATTIEVLQTQVGRFVTYYNQVRPHRAKGRRTPLQAFTSLAKAMPSPPRTHLSSRDLRVRHDHIDDDGKLTLRYRSKLHHIGMGRALRGVRVVMLVADRDVRIVSENGELLRAFTLDPSRDYQPQARS